MSGGFDAGSPAADRAFDAGVIVGLAIAQAGKFQAARIRDAIRKVTAPGGEVVYAGPQGFARALQLIREKKPVRYIGVIGPVQFDKYGDIAGPFRTWKIANGEVVTVGQISADDVAAIQARLPK
jgi:branched-chain amino acid transport system substrate-binding protein